MILAVLRPEKPVGCAITLLVNFSSLQPSSGSSPAVAQKNQVCQIVRKKVLENLLSLRSKTRHGITRISWVFREQYSLTMEESSSTIHENCRVRVILVVFALALAIER